jgi:hypothetical protein
VQTRWLGRLGTFAVYLILLTWLACSVGITVWLSEVADLDLNFDRKSGVRAVAFIFLIPIGVWVAVDELIVQRLRFGPPVPGRRVREVSTGDERSDESG